jgi:hypothetical protein
MALDFNKPFQFIGFGAVDVTKLYRFLVVCLVTSKPHKFTGFRGSWLPPCLKLRCAF